MTRRLFLHLWLGFIFLLAQQEVYLHVHSPPGTPAQSAQHADKGQPSPQTCDRCLELAALGAAAPSSTLPLPSTSEAPRYFPAATSLFFSRFRCPYLSRGPPVFA